MEKKLIKKAAADKRKTIPLNWPFDLDCLDKNQNCQSPEDIVVNLNSQAPIMNKQMWNELRFITPTC